MADLLKITAIVPSTRDPDRVRIRVGRKTMAVLGRRSAEQLGLSVGMAWTDEVAAKAGQFRAVEKAYRSAMNRLARRPLARRELRFRLIRAGHDAGAVDLALDRLVERGYLNDRALADMAARDLAGRKKAGRRLIVTKLKQRGIEGEEAEQAADEALEQVDAAAAAAELIEKHLPRLRRHPVLTRRRRLWSMLARRGYDSEAIDGAFRRVDIGDAADGDDLAFSPDPDAPEADGDD